MIVAAIAAPVCAGDHDVIVGDFTISEQSGAVMVRENNQPVLTYQAAHTSLDGTYRRADYVHPLYDLDGDVLTEDFPDDHRHHRGVFWAWHQVWVGDQRMGDPWICRDFEWDVRYVVASEANDGSLRLTATVLWKSPALVDATGRRIPFVEETATIRVHRRGPSQRAIDFSIRLSALVDGVRIGGSEDVKGYGGFSPRLRLSPELEFVSRDGAVEPQTTAVVAGPWMDIGTDRSGVAILTHPANPGFPTPWILRRARSMQNAVYPGRDPVPLKVDDPLVLRYRLVIHRGSTDDTEIDQKQRDYERGSQ